MYNVYLENRPFFISFHGSSAVVAERFPNLVRAHRGFYINPDQVFSINMAPDNMVEIVFKDGKQLEFSRSKKLNQSLIEFLEKNG